MPLLQGLIFDLDGTLLDSAPDLRRAVNKTLRAHGRRDLTTDEVKQMVGDGMLSMMGKAFAATGDAVPDSQSYATFQEFISCYRAQKPDPSQIYPHTMETLEHFYKAEVKLGICTNKQEASTLQLLEALKMKHYFTFIAGGDTFPVHKPNPGHITGVIEKLGVPWQHCVMVGDGPNDVLAAHGAGIPSIIITHGYAGDYAHLRADASIGGFRELPSTLEALGFAVHL